MMNDNPKQPIDRLMDRGRIRGESRMIPEGTDAAAVTREQAQAVIDAILAYIDQTKLSRTSIARDLNIAASTLGTVLNWKYPGHWREVVIDLDRWLEAQQKRDAAPKTTDFCWTEVAKEILTVADIASTLKTIGLVYGPTTSGIGKTMALQAIREEKPGAILVTAEKVNATVSGLLKSICKAMRIADDGSQSVLNERIKLKLAGSARLLMIDEIHNLCDTKGDKCFFVLVQLFNATKSPQLWCGTTDIVAYLDRKQASGMETLAQVRRRIGISRDLMERTRKGDGGKGQPLFTIQEIRKIFARNKIRLAPDAGQYLAQIANLEDSGSLGICKHIVDQATLVAEMEGDNLLTAELLRACHRSLVNGRAFTLLEARLEEASRPAIKVG